LVLQVKDAAASRWNPNEASEPELKLRAALVKMLEGENHTNIQPFGFKIVSGPDGKYRRIDTAVIADDCAVIADHRHVMTVRSAERLYSLIAFIE
jgi:hypothetical protein